MGKKKSKTSKKKPAAAQRELPLERPRTEGNFLKYVKLLKLFAKKYCVMIVASDTPVGPAILQNLHQHISVLNTYFDEAGIAEVLSVPRSCFDLNGVRRFEDAHGKYINISGGHRETAYQPETFQRTIFLVGGCGVFGIGTDDRRTTASCLQEQCNRHVPDAGYIVQNYGYYLAGEDIKDGEIIGILNSLPVKPGDVVVFDSSIRESEDLLWIDLPQVSEGPRTYEMFFDKGHFTPDGYRIIARKSFKGLMELGLLRASQQSAQEQNKAVPGGAPGDDLRSTHDFAGYLRLLKKYAQNHCVLVSSWERSDGFYGGVI